MAKAPANAAQIDYWNEVSGPRWVAAQERLDPMIEGIGLAGIERAGIRSGESVVDVGCGCGATSLALAARVGADGQVLGVDISGPMLERARERALAAGVANLRFEQSDAQTHAFTPVADTVFSRFGVMFFEDSVAAFRNLRRCLRPGGRLCFVCWQPLAENPWMALPMQAIAPFVEARPRPEPGAPGPFAFADPTYVRSILEDAGYEAIDVESYSHVQRMGSTTEDALDFLLTGVGPVSSALAEATVEARDAATAALRDLLSRREGPNGVEFDSAVWIVTARAPDGR
jgi:SAM-dependent methyltransferase